MSDVRNVAPVTEADYEAVRAHIAACRAEWETELDVGLAELVSHLTPAGHVVVESLGQGEVAVSGRVKSTDAIVSKMRRYGEPLRVMLDVFGFRVVVPGSEELDAVAQRCAELWETPAAHELLLRHGALQFDWWRDYRKRNHAGLSAATTTGYDEAIHLNRRAPFGIVEIQVLTRELFRRAHCDSGDDSHDQFVARRNALFPASDRGGTDT